MRAKEREKHDSENNLKTDYFRKHADSMALSHNGDVLSMKEKKTNIIYISQDVSEDKRFRVVCWKVQQMEGGDQTVPLTSHKTVRSLWSL